MDDYPKFNIAEPSLLYNATGNKVLVQDRSFHEWYRFVLAFPPHLVRDYFAKFGLSRDSVVLDPFCGTGTTLIEAKLANMSSYGIEANKFAYYASSLKLSWDIDPDSFLRISREVAESVYSKLESQSINDSMLFDGDVESLNLLHLSPDEEKLILTNSISPLPLHKILVLRDSLQKCKNESFYNHQMLALAYTLVNYASNLNFGPEVGVGKQKKDVPVIHYWLEQVMKMAYDIKNAPKDVPLAKAIFADSRDVRPLLEKNSIDAVITSPPYPNEKDYTRITRLESVVLGFVSNRDELRVLKKGLIRSNTRNVYKGDDDDKWIECHPEIQLLADQIENRRIELGKTSGFERLYGKVTKLYFGGMARHLDSLKDVLRPNAKLAYVVGDQASYLRVMIHTGELLAKIAEALGYEVESIDLFRTRLATATRDQLREEVVVLRYKG